MFDTWISIGFRKGMVPTVDCRGERVNIILQLMASCGNSSQCSIAVLSGLQLSCIATEPLLCRTFISLLYYYAQVLDFLLLLLQQLTTLHRNSQITAIHESPEECTWLRHIYIYIIYVYLPSFLFWQKCVVHNVYIICIYV